MAAAARSLDAVAQAAILECLRKVFQNEAIVVSETDIAGATGHIKNVPAMAKILHRREKRVSIDAITSCLRGHPRNDHDTPLIANAALAFLREHKQQVIDICRMQMSKPTVDFLEQTLSARARAVDFVFQNWKDATNPAEEGDGGGRKAIYQIFRRYKPERDPRKIESYLSPSDLDNPLRHALICELIYVDSGTSEAILITSDLNVYYGPLYFSRDSQLYGLLQRRQGPDVVKQRIIVQKMVSHALEFFTGFYLKAGDDSGYPVVSEVFYLRVPEDHHELHAAMGEVYGTLRNNDQRAAAVAVRANDIFAQYTSRTPPAKRYDPQDPEWKRVRRVEDEPACAKWARESDSEGNVMFKEPLRALRVDQLEELSVSGPPLTVFRRPPDPENAMPVSSPRHASGHASAKKSSG
jgi:hypothetical protein